MQYMYFFFSSTIFTVFCASFVLMFFQVLVVWVVKPCSDVVENYLQPEDGSTMVLRNVTIKIISATFEASSAMPW